MRQAGRCCHLLLHLVISLTSALLHFLRAQDSWTPSPNLPQHVHTPCPVDIEGIPSEEVIRHHFDIASRRCIIMMRHRRCCSKDNSVTLARRATSPAAGAHGFCPATTA